MRKREHYKRIKVYPDFARPRVGLSMLIKSLLFLYIRIILMFSIVLTLTLLDIKNIIHFPMWGSVLIAVGVDILIQLLFLSPTCLVLIRMYQVNMSMDVRMRCNLTPTCSEYCASVIQMKGIYRGFRDCWNHFAMCAQNDFEKYRVSEFPYIIVRKGE